MRVDVHEFRSPDEAATAVAAYLTPRIAPFEGGVELFPTRADEIMVRVHVRAHYRLWCVRRAGHQGVSRLVIESEELRTSYKVLASQKHVPDAAKLCLTWAEEVQANLLRLEDEITKWMWERNFSAVSVTVANGILPQEGVFTINVDMDTPPLRLIVIGDVRDWRSQGFSLSSIVPMTEFIKMQDISNAALKAAFRVRETL